MAEGHCNYPKYAELLNIGPMVLHVENVGCTVPIYNIKAYIP